MHRDYNKSLKYKLFPILVMVLCLGLNSSGFAWATEGDTNRDDLFSICFVDDTHGWVCGRWGTILHTSDGGKTWIEQEIRSLSEFE